jgi:outer membrane lipoprotein-sorting protein/thiol-disulfide isomerase/thioredoxin
MNMQWRRTLLTVVPLVLCVICGNRAHADSTADALLKKVAAATRAVQTISAEITTVTTSLTEKPQFPESKQVGTIQMARPNLLKLELGQEKTSPQFILISDGKWLWTMGADRKQGRKQTVASDGSDILFHAAMRPFFSADLTYEAAQAAGTIRYAGRQEVDGQAYEVLEARGKVVTVRWFIGKDHLVHRAQHEARIEGSPQRSEVIYTRMKVNTPLPPSAFAFVPAAPDKFPLADPAAGLLSLGTQAQDFELDTPDGRKLRLSDVYKNARVTLVSFWDWGCGSCHTEMPLLQSLSDRFKSQGLRVVTVHFGIILPQQYPNGPKDNPRYHTQKENDPLAQAEGQIAYTADSLHKYMTDYGYTLPIMLDVRGKMNNAFKVTGSPTTYLLDSNGKIIGRPLGWDIRILQAELAKVGIR